MKQAKAMTEAGKGGNLKAFEEKRLTQQKEFERSLDMEERRMR